MTTTARWTMRLMPLAVLIAGCQGMPSARYVGTGQDLYGQSQTASTAGIAETNRSNQQDVVRGQGGQSPQSLWNDYGGTPTNNPQYWSGAASNAGAPPQPTGPTRTASRPQAEPAYPQTQPNNYPPASNASPPQPQQYAAPVEQPYQPNTQGSPANALSSPPPAPIGSAVANGPRYSGDVGGTIPVQGNPQPMPVITGQPITQPLVGEGLPPGPVFEEPDPFRTAPVDVFVDETETGRFMFGVGVNSDAGVTGNIVVDERNFDLFRWPTSFGEILDGTAFRGAGQGLRIEAVPGTELQRYVVNFTQPYLLNTNVSFNTSGFYYTRRFSDWDEERKGGRVGLGYRLTPDVSVALSLRGEQVTIDNPRSVASPELNASLGTHDIFGSRLSLTYDTRDIPFAPTEGQMIELSYEQVFGDFDYPRVEADYRRYFLIAERPDGSGRHVLAVQLSTGITGSQTPVFENFFAGGYSTLRGFDFRGASPVEGGVAVGGEFSLLGTVEYLFPITADDMLKGVAFVDYGTVEEDIAIRSENFRVAPGVGLRIFIPAMGPAPIALDFAFPVASAATDEEEIFSFFVGFGR